jgi:hypothetical protein
LIPDPKPNNAWAVTVQALITRISNKWAQQCLSTCNETRIDDETGIGPEKDERRINYIIFKLKRSLAKCKQ